LALFGDFRVGLLLFRWLIRTYQLKSLTEETFSMGLGVFTQQARRVEIRNRVEDGGGAEERKVEFVSVRNRAR